MALTVPLVIGDRGGPALGYLKPLIRTRVLGALRYDETLRIGEDFDFLLRLVLGGVRAWLVPEPWYLYRRHASSISHRLPADALEAMIESMSRMIGEPATAAAGTRALLADRIAGLRAHLDYARVVDDLKAGRFGAAMGRLIRQPAMTARLGGWLASQVQRPFTALAGATPRHSATRHTIALADDAEGSLPSEWSFGRLVTVPAYVPSNAVDWTAASDRAAWLQIAALGMGANDLHPVGRAGAYAAGFSPGHPVQITEPYPAPTQTAAYPHATAALGAAE